jgi:hypothetical protein
VIARSFFVYLLITPPLYLTTTTLRGKVLNCVTSQQGDLIGQSFAILAFVHFEKNLSIGTYIGACILVIFFTGKYQV